MKKTIILLLIWLTSCNSNTEFVKYENEKQLLNVNNKNQNGLPMDSITLESINADTAKIGERYSAKVFLSNPEYKIVKAYYNCRATDEFYVDTLKKEIVGCSDQFIVKDDTIRISFTPGGGSQNREFLRITALSIDKKNVFRYHHGTFKFVVVK